jgi:hypothetical protein
VSVTLVYRKTDNLVIEKRKSFDENDDNQIMLNDTKALFEDTSPRNNANLLSKIFFFWVSPLISVSFF